MGQYLSDRQFRFLETGSRIFLTVAILAFIVVAVDTKDRMDTIEKKIKNGQCSYLVNQGMITTSEGHMNYSELAERNYFPKEPAKRDIPPPE